MAIILKSGYVELVGKVKKTIATNIGSETVVINVEVGEPFACPGVSVDELIATGVAEPAKEKEVAPTKTVKATKEVKND